MIEYSTEMEPKPTAMDATAAPDNAMLIEKIVRGKDRDAFAELFRRFELPAYQLALHLAGRRALAEEAVQDAMLAVWHGAESFRPDGDLRRWILGVVAHRALRASRKERKSQKAMDYQRERQRAVPERQRTDGDAEHGEVLAALRELVDRLPDLERKLVALYYGAEMTQEEIGAALDMPQRTVSFKLQACLERLRKNLAQTGMAAAAPLLTPQVLMGTVLESGGPAPGLLARTLARCDAASAPRESGARSARAAVAGGSKAVVAGAVLAVVLAAAPYVALNRAQDSASAPPPAATPPVVTATPAAKQAEPPVPPAELRTWMFKFDKLPGEGFDYIQGSWRLGTFGPDKRTGLIADDASAYNAFLLPNLRQKETFQVTVRFHVLHTGPLSISVGLSDGEQSHAARSWPAIVPYISKPNTSAEFISYYFEKVTVSVSGDWLGPVSLNPEAASHQRIFFVGQNIALESIEIKELRPEEIPERYRDMESLIRGRTEDPAGVKSYRWGAERVRPLAAYLKENAMPENQGR